MPKIETKFEAYLVVALVASELQNGLHCKTHIERLQAVRDWLAAQEPAGERHLRPDEQASLHRALLDSVEVEQEPAPKSSITKEMLGRIGEELRTPAGKPLASGCVWQGCQHDTIRQATLDEVYMALRTADKAYHHQEGMQLAERIVESLGGMDPAKRETRDG